MAKNATNLATLGTWHIGAMTLDYLASEITNEIQVNSKATGVIGVERISRIDDLRMSFLQSS